MEYYYEVVESESKDFPIGMEWLSVDKMHDGRRKETELADKNCKSWKFKLVHKCKGHIKQTRRADDENYN